jgi:hypothetical protein
VRVTQSGQAAVYRTMRMKTLRSLTWLLALLAGACFIPSAHASGQASFAGLDTTTQGNWRGIYGADGYSIESDFQSIPLYASFAVQNGLNYVWDPYPSETRDLQRASTSARIAATWYSTQSFSFNINFTDGNTHEFALYALDWDSQGRSETIQISDANTGAALDARTISNFSNGVYLVWNLAGHVTISVTVAAGPNGVISGAFFGGSNGSNAASNVTVSPPVANLAAGQTQQFTALVQNLAGQAVTWSISPNLGTISSIGLYTAPAAVTSAQALTVTAASSAGTGTATVDLTPGAAASFVTSDSSTQGNWHGIYGGDGYSVAGDSQSIPGYASFAVQDQVNYTWAASTSDSRALQTGNGAGRIAAAWYNPQTYTFDVNFTDRAFHPVALYAIDWDALGRAETIQILDANTQALLDTRTISNFANGVYLSWNLYGHVTIQVTTTNSVNAEISGVFFGGGTSSGSGANAQGGGSAPSGTVSFVALDSTTQGNWQGAYGTDGYFVANDSENMPVYANFDMQNQFNYVWDANGVQARDLEKASGPGRIAATWYNPRTFTFDVNFTDGNSHTFALYALDWDNFGRAETVQILDANTNAVLDSRSVANFTNGVYLVWKLSGHVTLSVTTTSDANAAISGMFFGGAGSSSTGDPSNPAGASVNFIASDAATQGTWHGVYGTDGYSVANDSQLIPPYATLAVQNQLNYTWVASSTDPRALQTGSGSGRLATAWYSAHDAIPPTFDFDVNFIDGNPHQFGIYAIDWDSQGRAETIQILDAATNAVLDTRRISNFTNGIYLVWTISGHVKVSVSETVGPNCVVSGVFFGGIPGLINVNVSPQSVNVPVGRTQQFSATVTGTTNQNVAWSISPSVGTISATGLYTAPGVLTSIQPITVTATSAQDGTRFGTATVNLTAAAVAFVANDATTQGNWHGVYGADGYSIAGDSQSVPAYASLAVQNPNGMWIWNGNTSDPRALQTGSGSGRIAAAWYKNHDSFYFDVNLADGQTHQLAIYALDWDSTQRSETVQVLDATTNALLDSRVISSFNGGVYLVWNISGHVTININVASGANAVISGVFFK